MAYARSSPHSPTSPDDWLARGPQSAKTYSTSSSRSYSNHASRTYSLASASSRALNSANYENNAHTYYVELKTYLKDLLAQEAMDGVHPHRVTARQKLVRLSNLQFHELAMDVYDEVVRRNKNDKFLPFLAVKEEFHPKRNQARQKLATLPVARFQDLASDVYAELTRRYPGLIDDMPPIPKMPNSPISPIYANGQPQPSKSTNIVPVKGMISVEDLDSNFSDTDDNHNSSVSSPPLASRNNNSQSPVSSGPKEAKDYFSKSPNDTGLRNNSLEIERIRSEYEYKISTMSDQIKQLQDQVALNQNNDNNNNTSSKADKDAIDELRLREQEDQRTIQKMEEQYQKLNDRYQALDREYTQQQEAVRNVKKETKDMLDELKRVAKANEDLIAEKEESEIQIQKLKDQQKEWQMKYEKARIELRNIRASSIIELDGAHDLIKENFLKPTRDGVIAQDHVLTYQAHVDEILTVARSGAPSQIINVMKSIVTVCRSITEEIESQEEMLPLHTKESLYDLKTRFSNSLSDLLTAAKHHASGMGLSPVSLLDRSTGHLTAVIIELVKLLGMHSSSSPATNGTTPLLNSSSKYESTNNERLDNNSYYYNSSTSAASRGLDSHNKNIVSSNTDDGRSLKSGVDSFLRFNGTKDSNSIKKSNSTYSRKYSQSDDMTPEELVNYLKIETDNIVQTIQDLLAALRLPQQNGEAFAIISSLLKVVATISELSRATCQSSQGYRYQSECEPLLSQLNRCSQRISMTQIRYFARGAIATGNAKRDLAKEAYEVAKLTKELINLFESK